MCNTIYWFSGTGNSLYAAKLLAELIGNTALVQITNDVLASTAVGGEGCKIGFVFPSYYGDLPRIVRFYVEKLNILPETDLFTVVTIGAFGQGSVKAMEELLVSKGLTLRYGIGVRMSANYILNYDPAIFGAKSARRVNKKLNKADQKIRRITDDIISGKHQIKKNTLTAKTLYENVEALDSDFTVTEKCTGCGLCERMCPVENIKLINDKPTWLHHCEHCVACISWCPVVAIEYGQITKQRVRYHNPLIKSAELEKRTTRHPS